MATAAKSIRALDSGQLPCASLQIRFCKTYFTMGETVRGTVVFQVNDSAELLKAFPAKATVDADEESVRPTSSSSGGRTNWPLILKWKGFERTRIDKKFIRVKSSSPSPPSSSLPLDSDPISKDLPEEENNFSDSEDDDDDDDDQELQKQQLKQQQQQHQAKEDYTLEFQVENQTFRGEHVLFRNFKVLHKFKPKEFLQANIADARAKKTFEFPFEFDLPSNLPPSFFQTYQQYRNGKEDRCKALVVYKVYCFLDHIKARREKIRQQKARTATTCSSSSSCCCTSFCCFIRACQRIFVINPIVLRPPTPLRASDFRAFFLHEGRIEARVSLDRHLFSPTDSVRVLVELENSTRSHVVQAIDLSVQRSTRFSVTKNNNFCRESVSSSSSSSSATLAVAERSEDEDPSVVVSQVVCSERFDPGAAFSIASSKYSSFRHAICELFSQKRQGQRHFPSTFSSKQRPQRSIRRELEIPLDPKGAVPTTNGLLVECSYFVRVIFTIGEIASSRTSFLECKLPIVIAFSHSKPGDDMIHELLLSSINTIGM